MFIKFHWNSTYLPSIFRSFWKVIFNFTFPEITSEKEKNILVYDLGGGTFDVSLLTIDNGALNLKISKTVSDFSFTILGVAGFFLFLPIFSKSRICCGCFYPVLFQGWPVWLLETSGKKPVNRSRRLRSGGHQRWHPLGRWRFWSAGHAALHEDLPEEAWQGQPKNQPTYSNYRRKKRKTCRIQSSNDIKMITMITIVVLPTHHRRF